MFVIQADIFFFCLSQLGFCPLLFAERVLTSPFSHMRLLFNLNLNLADIPFAPASLIAPTQLKDLIALKDSGFGKPWSPFLRLFIIYPLFQPGVSSSICFSATAGVQKGRPSQALGREVPTHPSVYTQPGRVWKTVEPTQSYPARLPKLSIVGGGGPWEWGDFLN